MFALSLIPPANPGATDRGLGLPAARVSLPPGPPGRREAVSISTFRGDGWMTAGDEPTVFRVLPGGAEVLMTLYWSTADAEALPPPLRLVRLNPEPAAGGAFDTSRGAVGGGTTGVASPAGVPFSGVPPGGAPFGGAQPGGSPSGGAPFGGFPAQEPISGPSARGVPGLSPSRSAEVIAHIEGIGDVDGKFGDWVGMRGSGRAIEGFSLTPHQGISTEDFEIRGVLGRDWLSPWLPGSSFCGSRGLALPLRGFCIRLHPAAAARFDLACFARFVDGSEVGPVAADRVCASPSLASLEAFQVLVRPRVA
jgi:hypothetical protein